ncbi:BTAD domain-containing putative transcriptional regulator, partial [Klebsiella pneumoniae]|uniref:BTAD domain-containing putative transcriptional regulator n=1 Tax=Klebsiella pneumoniae TaxID=573 RepID=UPI003A89DA6F
GLHEGAGRFERALQAAREHVDVDPLDEPAQRRLMQLLAAAGHTAAALQQFERSRTLLREQLGVEPDAAT